MTHFYTHTRQSADFKKKKKNFLQMGRIRDLGKIQNTSHLIIENICISNFSVCVSSCADNPGSSEHAHCN